MLRQKISQKKPNRDTTVVDFGTRTVYVNGNSRGIKLPKVALANVGIDIGPVRIFLVQKKDEKYIKIASVANQERVA